MCIALERYDELLLSPDVFGTNWIVSFAHTNGPKLGPFFCSGRASRVTDSRLLFLWETGN